jgi:hypothetical protein
MSIQEYRRCGGIESPPAYGQDVVDDLLVLEGDAGQNFGSCVKTTWKYSKAIAGFDERRASPRGQSRMRKTARRRFVLLLGKPARSEESHCRSRTRMDYPRWRAVPRTGRRCIRQAAPTAHDGETDPQA